MSKHRTGVVARHVVGPRRTGLQANATDAKRPLSKDCSWQVLLNYQEPPPPGKRIGRYIDQEDKGDVVDEHFQKEVTMYNARQFSDVPSMESTGFELRSHPTQVKDFSDNREVESVYYGEIMDLVKKATGANRVLVFDTTLRKSGSTNLNAVGGESIAAPVPRVHCDYTHEGAPLRLMQLANDNIYSRLRKRTLTAVDFKDLASRRFAFVNVWRSIADTPVQRMPLAVCDTRTVPKEDMFLYELIFPRRTGLNYSLKPNDGHKWCYYPDMEKDECLVFKVYDKKEDGPRFVFHTAFEDACTTSDSPTRESIEVRTIAFFDNDASDNLAFEGASHGAHE